MNGMDRSTEVQHAREADLKEDTVTGWHGLNFIKILSLRREQEGE